eukprot:284816052_4
MKRFETKTQFNNFMDIKLTDKLKALSHIPHPRKPTGDNIEIGSVCCCRHISRIVESHCEVLSIAMVYCKRSQAIMNFRCAVMPGKMIQLLGLGCANEIRHGRIHLYIYGGDGHFTPNESTGVIRAQLLHILSDFCAPCELFVLFVTLAIYTKERVSDKRAGCNCYKKIQYAIRDLLCQTHRLAHDNKRAHYKERTSGLVLLVQAPVTVRGGLVRPGNIEQKRLECSGSSGCLTRFTPRKQQQQVQPIAKGGRDGIQSTESQ